MGNSVQKNYSISPNIKDLQKKIEQLIKENEKLKKKNIQIQIRSIFLQGLLINKKVYKKKYFG